MKKLSKAMALILAFALIFSLAGCTAKKPITIDEFQDIMEDEGFNVNGNTFEYLVDGNHNHDGEYGTANDAKYSSTNEEDPLTLLWLYIYASEDDAKDFFEKDVGNQKDIIEDEDWDAKITTKSSDDYDKFTFKAETDDEYILYRVVIRIENTVLFVHAYSKSKSDVKAVDDIVRKLGY